MKLKILIGILIILVGVFLISLGAVKRLSTEQTYIPIFDSQSVVIPSPSPEPQPVSLIFGGDMMFDRHIRKAITEKGPQHILSSMTQYLNSSHLVIANLEGPVTTNLSTSLGSVVGSPQNFIFTFDPGITQILNDNNINIVNLGNNHILNFGQDGLRQTYSYLKDASIGFFGQTGTEDISQRYLITEIEGIRLGLVNYNQFLPGGQSAVMEDIQLVRPQVDVLIVYTHWGNEYETVANQVIQALAHQLIDSGADLIIGSHPHVVQQREEYQGKIIYYSLGNFIFDQYFSPEVQQGLLVQVSIDPITYQITTSEQPISMIPGGQTALISY